MNQHQQTLSTADLARTSGDPRDLQDEQEADVDVGTSAPEKREAVSSIPSAGAAAVAASGAPHPATVTDQGRPNTPTGLFSEQEAAGLRKQWSDVQGGFVDEPRRAVKQADSLVAHVMTKLAEGFAKERTTLEQQWDRGNNVTTEDLRVALRRYRSFFDRLLSA